MVGKPLITSFAEGVRPVLVSGLCRLFLVVSEPRAGEVFPCDALFHGAPHVMSKGPGVMPEPPVRPRGCSASVRLIAARAACAHREQGIGVGDELDGIRCESAAEATVRVARLKVGEELEPRGGPEVTHSVYLVQIAAGILKAVEARVVEH